MLGKKEAPAYKREVEKKDVTQPQAPILQKISTKQSNETPTQKEIKQDDVSTHPYLQTLVKKMAEARGYTATIEAQTPLQNGSVDVLLFRDNKTIAVEICVTTDADWEMHNIAKCVEAGYTTVISLSGDMKQLEKIKQKCKSGIADFEKKPVLFFTPAALFSFLDESVKEQIPDEVNMKGYRVNVTYDTITNEEMDRKRASVAQVILNTLRKHKKIE